MTVYCNEEIDAVESASSGLFFYITPTKAQTLRIVKKDFSRFIWLKY